MAYLNEAGVTALWNKLKKRDITGTSISTEADSAQLDLVYGSGDKSSFVLSGASADAAGLMSAADKTKLDSLAIDSAFSTTSTNAIQNKTVTNLLDGIYTEMGIDSTTVEIGDKGSYSCSKLKQYVSHIDANGVLDLNAYAEPIYTIGFRSSQFAQWTSSDSFGGKLYAYSLKPDQTFTSVKVDTPAAGDSSTLCATTAFVQDAINAAMTSSSSFQGTTKDYTTIANTDYKKGWYWVANAAFTLGSESIEVGDMIFCISTKESASATADFSVVQANLTSIPTTYIDALS